MGEHNQRSIKKNAILLEQNPNHPVLLFAMTAEEVMQVADISRIARTGDGNLLGYQRGEARRHIQEIVSYLNGDDILFPNSLILAFAPEVSIQSGRLSPGVDRVGEMATVTIPIPKDGEAKPGWVVDGQQRLTALMRSKRKNWPIPVTAFVAADISFQRDQFLRVNNSKPLPRGLICELLPEVSVPLPKNLSTKRIPSALCNRLNHDSLSPFHRLIRRASNTDMQKRTAVVADASIIKMLEESLTTPSGCFFAYHNIATGETDFQGIWALLTAYWSAVRNTFPEAWAKPPAQSRLMHGTGLRAMGRVMDRMLSGVNPREPNMVAHLETGLKKVAPVCRWTAGRWEDLGLDWREIQNVPRHLRLVSNVLVRTYLQIQGGKL